ncbi:MAG: hypothetical protein WAT12_01790, partial [Candidatus Nitrotoga sp.]
MLSRGSIEQQLQNVPKELVVAFAARCALRVLPMLVSDLSGEKGFGYWKDEDRAKHLLSIYRGLYIGIVARATAYSAVSAAAAAAADS